MNQSIDILRERWIAKEAISRPFSREKFVSRILVYGGISINCPAGARQSGEELANSLEVGPIFALLPVINREPDKQFSATSVPDPPAK